MGETVTDEKEFEQKVDELGKKIDQLNDNLKNFLDILIPLIQEEMEMEVAETKPKTQDPTGNMYG